MTDVHVSTVVTEYRVSPLPVERPDSWPYNDYEVSFRSFALLVQRRGKDRWVIANGFGECLALDGTWSRERSWAEYRATHYFRLGPALRLARYWAPRLEVKGRTAADLLALAET